MKKNIAIIIFILIIASVFRLWQLGHVPVSMSDDEVRLTYNSYSIWKTAKDISGNTFPLFFVVGGYAFNPVPIYITSLFVGTFGLNMFASRLPFAISGIMTVILLYLITNKLLKNKSIAILSSLALSFSAWHLQLSRFAYEGTISFFFYVLGVLIFISVKKNNILFTVMAMLSFLFGFYSYSGYKLILLPIMAVLIWYKYKDLSFKQFTIIILFILFTFSTFVFLGKTQNATKYGSQIFFFQDFNSAAKAIELERRASQSPDFIEKLYHNKLTFWSKIFAERYSYAFSPQYLFNSQEQSGVLSIWFRGELYYVEALFFVLGALYIFYKKRKEFLLIILFLIIAPIPSGLGAEPITYAIRSSFMLPWLYIIIGAGIYSLSYFIKNRKFQFFAYCLTAIIYLYFIVGYLDQYYSNWSKYGANYYSKADQDLVFLINKNKDIKSQIIADGTNPMTFLHYAFYNKTDPSLVQKLYPQNKIYIDNIVFEDNCFHKKSKESKKQIDKNSLYILSGGCPGIKPGKRKGKTEYIMDPDLIIKSFDNTEEWLVFEN